MPLTLRSPVFGQNEQIPKRFTSDGEDVSPPLEWTEVPQGTRSFVLIVDDPDAPDPSNPKTTFVHWLVYNLPANLTDLAAAASDDLPRGAKQGVNDWKQVGWGGPNPPIGEHRYFFKIYALDVTLDLDRPTKDRLLKAMDGHILGKSDLIGKYKKEAVATR